MWRSLIVKDFFGKELFLKCSIYNYKIINLIIKLTLSIYNTFKHTNFNFSNNLFLCYFYTLFLLFWPFIVVYFCMIIYLTLRHYNGNIIDLSYHLLHNRWRVNIFYILTYILDLPDILSIYCTSLFIRCFFIGLIHQTLGKLAYFLHLRTIRINASSFHIWR